MSESNNFNLIGRVGKLEIKYFETGSVITTISIGVKNYKKEYENFWIKFFKEKAEKIAEQVKEGDYIRVTGSLAINLYKPDGAEKEKKTLTLIGWGFKKVVFDKEKKKFVDVECEDVPPV